VIERVGAVVLAGGRSSRFGSDKLAADFDGRPLLRHAIDGVRAIAGVVVVVVAPGAAPPLPDGVRVAHDARPFDGPLAGLAAGLAAIGPDVERVVVVGGDMPRLVPAVLRRLVAALVGDPAAVLAVLAVGDDRPPLPMAIDARRGTVAVTDLLERGERRLRALTEDQGPVVVPEVAWRADDPAGSSLLDIDEVADLGPPA
jgi:molybdenum cofactor guanylyltransferase